MKQFRSTAYRRWQGLCAHAFLGAVAGMLLLHPLTKAIYVTQLHGARSEVEQLALAFTPSMLPMTGAFALLGAVVGLVFGFYHRLLAKQSAPSVFSRPSWDGPCLRSLPWARVSTWNSRPRHVGTETGDT